MASYISAETWLPALALKTKALPVLILMSMWEPGAGDDPVLLACDCVSAFRPSWIKSAA